MTARDWLLLITQAVTGVVVVWLAVSLFLIWGAS